MGDMMTRHTFLPDRRGVGAVASSAEPFRTADGYMTIAPLTDKHWTALLTAVGHPEWFEGDEPRTERVKNAARKLIELFPTQPSAYWLERIEAADVPCGPVNDFDTIWSDPQFVANQTFFEYEHPQAGRVRAVRTPARFSRTHPELKHHAPGLGQQTDEVLAEFGFDPAEITALRERKVIN